MVLTAILILVCLPGGLPSFPLDMWVPRAAPRPPVAARQAVLSQAGTLALGDGRHLFVLRRGSWEWKQVIRPMAPGRAGDQGHRVTGMVFCGGRLLVSGPRGLMVWTQGGGASVVGPRDMTKLAGIAVDGRRVLAWSRLRIWESEDCGVHWQSRLVAFGARIRVAASAGPWRVWLTDRGLNLSLGWRVPKYRLRVMGMRTMAVAQMASGPVVVLAGRGIVRMVGLRTGRFVGRLVLPCRRLVADPGGGFWALGPSLIRVPPKGRAHREDMGLPSPSIVACSSRQVVALGPDGVYGRSRVLLSRLVVEKARRCLRGSVSTQTVSARAFARAMRRTRLAAVLPTLSVRAGVVSPGVGGPGVGFGWWLFGQVAWRPSSLPVPSGQDQWIRIRRRVIEGRLRWQERASACRRWKFLVERNLSDRPVFRLGLRLGLDARVAMLEGRRLLDP